VISSLSNKPIEESGRFPVPESAGQERPQTSPITSFPEGAMHCLRCEGLMITIRMEELSSAGQVPGWRCLVCGETTDPGIH